MKDKFWNKTAKCSHVWNPNYIREKKCETPYCDVIEEHCLKCGIYRTRCGCGYNNGYSGWSLNRCKKAELRKKV